METRVRILDELIGLDQDTRIVKPYEDAQIMLIRGAPGSGKSTLSLEILARHVNEGPPNFGIFWSLEVEPVKAWFAAIQRLSPTLNYALGFEKLSDHIKHDQKGFSIVNLPNTRLILIGKDWCKTAIPMGTSWDILEARLGKELVELVNKVIRNDIDTAQVAQQTKKVIPGLIVIDSVNLLAEYVQKALSAAAHHADIRSAMHRVCMVLERQKEILRAEKQMECHLLLTGEHHPGASYDISLLSESFACDIEVLLVAEPIAGTPSLPLNLLSTLGYSFERQQDDKDTVKQAIEIRSFARVLKSRFSPNQSRRCAYDIVPGIGVHFQELYPGDGAVHLYYENAKQKENWNEFLSEDVRRQFPALRYALFDRAGSQHKFATERSLHQLHQKTDMTIVSFDTYWINWYWQLGKRTHLANLLTAAFPPSRPNSPEEAEKSRADWMQFLSIMDKFTTNAIVHPEIVRKIIAERCFPSNFLFAYAKAMKNPFVRNWLNRQKLKEPHLLPPGMDEIFTHDKMLLTEKMKVVGNCLYDVARDFAAGQVGLLKMIPKQDLKLFGERRSTIIWELERKRTSIHMPRTVKRGTHYLSVPYNANVSFLVINENLLGECQRALSKIGQHKLELAKQELQSAQARALHEYRKQFHARKRFQAKGSVGKKRNDASATAAKKDPDTKHYRQLKLLKIRTWEDILLHCTTAQYSADNVVAADDPPYKLAIETRSYDSFLCFFLEVFWAFGSQLHVNPNYEILEEKTTSEKLFQACFLVRELFRTKVIDRQSTVDPTKIETSAITNSHKWLFARHWYSTFVDILTAPSKDAPPKDPKHPWLYCPLNKPKFHIQPLPWSEYAQIHKGPVKPVSCWGEWHLAILKGSENQALGVDVINTLMSSTQICKRAARCAAVPTVQGFYDRYPHVPCLRLLEREDIQPINLTWNELRKHIFSCARSRTTIFDYKHCMREIHSVLLDIQHNPSITAEQLAQAVIKAVERIKTLRKLGALADPL